MTLRRRLFQVENSFSIKADEVYLITTSFVPWLVWCLRIGEASFFDLAESSPLGYRSPNPFATDKSLMPRADRFAGADNVGYLR
jgi:hypothetical protein